jgi:hypothetical protein
METRLARRCTGNEYYAVYSACMRVGYHRTMQIRKMMCSYKSRLRELGVADLTLVFPLGQAAQAAATCFRFGLEFWLGLRGRVGTSMICGNWHNVGTARS